MSNDDPDESEEAVGQRWKEYKKESWSRTGNDTGVGFVMDEKYQDPTYDWTSTKEGQKDFMDNLEQQYTYFCYGEKDYEACQKRAEFLQTFRMQYEQAQAEFERCCETYKTPGCCNSARQNLLVKPGLDKTPMKDFDFSNYWRYIKIACMAGDYPRSKQQHDNRSEACISLADSIRNMHLNTDRKSDAIGHLLNSMPSYMKENDFKQSLIAALYKNCNSECSKRYQSCTFLGAAFLNKRIGDAFNLQSDPLEGIELLKIGCDGFAPGLGVYGACRNLSQIYRRGNKKYGIPKSPELEKEYEHKAFLITPEGKMTIAQNNMPKAGELIS